MIKFLFLVLFLSLFDLGYGQDEKVVLIDENNRYSRVDSLENITPEKLTHFLIQLKNNKIQDGNYEFSIDSVFHKDEQYNIYLHQGKHYSSGNVYLTNPQNKGDNLATKSSFNDLKNRLKLLENNGYPFAEAIVKNIQIKDSILNIIVTIKPNKLMLIDSLVIKSEEKIEGKFLEKIIGITTGDKYNEALVKKIDTAIKKDNSYHINKETELLFTDDGVQIYLFLTKKQSNQFDGILGVQPNSDDKKVAFTGNLKFKLQNNFQRGEEITFDWKKLPSQTQNLLLKTAYPYIGFSNFGIKASLFIYKQDSSFISLNKNLGLSFRVSIHEEMGLFYDKRNSYDQQLNNDNTTDKANSNLVGMYYLNKKTDNALDPKKGYAVSISYAVGKRQESTEPAVTQHRSQAQISKFLPIYKGLNALLKIQEDFQTGGALLENEMIRFGGFQTLRGFDELSLQATAMVAATASLRYYLEEHTSLQLFFDQAWYEKNAKDTYTTDLPYGIGMGFSFLTSSGMLSFNYALGSQFGNPLDFRRGKIHFGLIGNF